MTARGRAESIAELLAEQSPRFDGRSTNDVERMRGVALAELAMTGLPPDAVPFVLEELETGRNPFTVAAAGRALRGATVVPDDAPELVVAAIGRLRGRDEVVPLDAPEGGAVTAVADLAVTLVILGARARRALPALRSLVANDGAMFSAAVRAELARAIDALAGPDDDPGCCCHETAGSLTAAAEPAAAVAPAAVLLEDQDGGRSSLADAFGGRPTALAFFYTRCMNPEKCSLTITRLARLSSRLVAEGIDANVGAISYDPGFDRPARLRTYGVDRGMPFSPRCALWRTVGPFEPLRVALSLGVGFGPVTVNRHRLDLVVLDAELRVAANFERRLWHEDAVVDAVLAAGRPASDSVRAR